MDETIKLITSLLPLLLDSGPLLLELIRQIREQTGMADTDILAHAKATNDENAVALLRERLRLQAEIDAEEN